MFSKDEKKDRLSSALHLCDIHCERMNFAYARIQHYFPLTVEIYEKMAPEDMSFFDQLIFRFAKLQDAMGHKLFPALLDYFEENTRGVPFIDILCRLEELEFLESKNVWIQMREIRNVVTHEYPFVTQEVVDGLNLLFKHSNELVHIWERMKEKINKILV